MGLLYAFFFEPVGSQTNDPQPMFDQVVTLLPGLLPSSSRGQSCDKIARPLAEKRLDFFD